MADEARWNQLTDEEREDHGRHESSERDPKTDLFFLETKYRNDGIYE